MGPTEVWRRKLTRVRRPAPCRRRSVATGRPGSGAGRLIAGFALLAAAGTSACRPPGTSTQWAAPVLTWRLESRVTGRKRVFTSDGEVKARPGESFILTLDAIEPHGIRRVRLEGGGRYSCVAGGAGASHPLVEPSHEQELERDENGQAISKVSLLRVVDTGSWSCDAGAFAGGELVFEALAENYTGGLAQSRLVIRRFR